MAAKSVWVVEQGQYSDYRVVGVFSSLANAKRIADAINTDEGKLSSDDATVAEWPLDPAVEDLQQGRSPFHVLMLRDGRVERVGKTAVSSYELAGSVTIWRRSTAPFYRGSNVQDALNATVWATDEPHAIKIANEARAQLIAAGRWKAKAE